METDENNTYSNLIGINKNQPDLTLNSVSFTGTNVVAGSNLEVLYSISNNSGFAVNQYEVGIYLSKDNTFKLNEDEI